MKQGTIVLVPFPFSDNPAVSKKRPAIIISNTLVNNDQDVIVAAITSQIRQDQFSYLLDNQDLTIPLKKASEVRCHKVFTMHKGLILKEITQLSAAKQMELFQKIAHFLRPNNKTNK